MRMLTNPLLLLIRVLLLTLLSLPAATLLAQPAPNLIRSYQGPASLGWAVADIADLDGDGKRDFIASALNTGQVIAYSSAQLTPLWTATPGLNSFGRAIASAGDVNGDGRSDVVAGAPSAGLAGQLRLLSGLDGQVLMSLTGPATSTRFGDAVSSIEDLDGDGVRELLVGAAGGSGWLHIVGADDGALIRSVQGNTAFANGAFGAGVAALRDIDRDGVEDYVVGAPGNAGGRAYVYSGASGQLLHTLAPQIAGGQFGEFFVADAGDVDGDGTIDIYVGAYAENNNNGAAYVFSGATGLRIHRIGGTPGEGLGPGRGIGDVDGDGLADLVVGAYTYSGAGLNQGGRVGVFSGANLSFLMRINGSRLNGQFGFDCVGLGDVDGDGRLDFIVASSPANSVDLFAGVVNRAGFVDGFEADRP